MKGGRINQTQWVSLQPTKEVEEGNLRPERGDSAAPEDKQSMENIMRVMTLQILKKIPCNGEELKIKAKVPDSIGLQGLNVNPTVLLP